MYQNQLEFCFQIFTAGLCPTLFSAARRFYILKFKKKNHMTTIMPQDIDGHPIPAVRLKEGGAHTINTGASSARNTTAFDPETRIISLYATDPFISASAQAVSMPHHPITISPPERLCVSKPVIKPRITPILRHWP